MRISNISNFLGGANRIIAREIVKGNQVKLPVSLTNSDNTPTDLSSHHFVVRAADFTSSITESRGSIIINSLTLSSEPNNGFVNLSGRSMTGVDVTNNDSVIEILDADQGGDSTVQDTFELTIPATIASNIDVPADVNTPPVVVMEVKYGIGDGLGTDENGTSNGTHADFVQGTAIDSIRWLIVLRYAP